MRRDQIKRGMIVVVNDGVAFGNMPNTITKILANHGCTDQMFERFGKKMKFKTYVLCKAKKNMNFPQTYRNAPCFMEVSNDLRPATTEEKKLFQKNNYEPMRLLTKIVTDADFVLSDN